MRDNCSHYSKLKQNIVSGQLKNQNLSRKGKIYVNDRETENIRPPSSPTANSFVWNHSFVQFVRLFIDFQFRLPARLFAFLLLYLFDLFVKLKAIFQGLFIKHNTAFRLTKLVPFIQRKISPRGKEETTRSLYNLVWCSILLHKRMVATNPGTRFFIRTIS